MHQKLEHFVPAADVPVLHAAFEAWLKEDRSRARALASGRTTAEAESLWSLLERGELQPLGPELDALLAGQKNELSSLSPRGHLKEVDVPAYLLHGAHDAVIPPSETELGDLELANSPHLALVSPLLEHVEVNGNASMRDELDLLVFMSHLF